MSKAAQTYVHAARAAAGGAVGPNVYVLIRKIFVFTVADGPLKSNPYSLGPGLFIRAIPKVIILSRLHWRALGPSTAPKI